MKLKDFFRNRKLKSKGIAAMELAFFIPIAYVLFHMILDITTLYRYNDKMQAVTGLATEMTLATIGKHKQISYSDMKKIAASAFNSFDNNLSDKFNCDIYISWEFVRKNDNLKTKYIYTKTKSGEIKEKDDRNFYLSDVKNYFAEETNYLNASQSQMIVVITVGITKINQETTWYGISEFSYNLAKSSMPSKFYAQATIFPQHVLQFPDKIEN